jgi:glycosyltransferase involved in cell wall biosynthesis
MTKMKQVRVLLVGNDADYFLTHRLPLAQKLAELGYDIHVALPFKLDDERFGCRPFVVHQIALRRGGVHAGEELRTTFELIRLYRRLRPQIVHHVTLKPTIYGGFAARLTGVPIVVNAMTGLGFVFTSSTLQARLIRMVAQWPLRIACRRRNVTMIFQNPEDLQKFADLGISYRECSVLIRGSGVDTRVFTPGSGGTTGQPVVMAVSRMLWDKGIAEFVAAARALKAAGSNARFVLVGGTDPNPSSVPEAQLRQWSEEGVVEWWGKRDNMPAVWRQADVACLPSYAEGLPKTLLEAAATGLPLVATDIPGCREVAREGLTGMLVAKGDAISLADALRRLIESPELRRTLGANARAIAEREFTIQSVIEQTLDVYQSRLSALAPAVPALESGEDGPA